ncbi:cell division protein ZapC domain-containing protein [Bowmanella sp. JS7-9]|uniref:Cell division protein ZapC n=1 Tax=Pseudobowmanella zhangzhouensis TaxID=1537679 RepID=A0ABW1XJD5_9ALTE|nr:cell division protein ZapC domain-containing protein [Bowmanella sp. JS7-9]TBX26054.1 hypothetical protein TK45_02325 [Bowmanella sp. JS7-9]
MLQPSKDWCWYYDKTQDCLAIELSDEMVFMTPYRAKQLNPDAQDRQGFSLEDMQFYIEVTEKLQVHAGEFSAAQLTQIALNATAVQKFYKPQMPKSWYFNRQSYAGVHAGLALLENIDGQGLVLQVEADQHASLCMLISASMLLDGQKSLKQFEVIKVMHNYLYPYLPDAPLARYA